MQVLHPDWPFKFDDTPAGQLYTLIGRSDFDTDQRGQAFASRLADLILKTDQQCISRIQYGHSDFDIYQPHTSYILCSQSLL